MKTNHMVFVSCVQLYWQMDTSGGIAIIYFLFCVLVGAIFLVNLITAVIFIRFDLAKRVT